MADGSYIDPTYDATDTVSKLNLTRERFERLRSIVEIKPGPPPIVSGFSVELELTHQDARDLIDALETAWHRIDDIERQNLNLIVERDAIRALLERAMWEAAETDNDAFYAEIKACLQPDRERP